MTTPFQQRPSDQQQQQQQQQQQERQNLATISEGDESGDMVMNPTMIGNMAPTHYGDTVSFSSGGNVNSVQTRDYSTSLQQMRVVSDAHHSVEQMLSRRIRFDVTCDFSDTLVKFGFLDQWLKNPMVKFLLSPYAMFTGTYCVAAVINSQPTQAGMALLAASPQDTEVIVDAHTTRNVPLQDFGAYPKQLVPFYSGLQNVLINLASSSESVLRIPYVGSRAMNEIAHLIDTTFVYTNISALREASSGGKLQVQFYGWMEDLVLYGTSTGEPTVSKYVGVAANVVARTTASVTKTMLDGFKMPSAEVDYSAIAFDKTEAKGYVVFRTTDAEKMKEFMNTNLELVWDQEGDGGFLAVSANSANLNTLKAMLADEPGVYFHKKRSEVDALITVSGGLPRYKQGGQIVSSVGACLEALNSDKELLMSTNWKNAFLEFYPPDSRAKFQSGSHKKREGRIPFEESQTQEAHEVGKEASSKNIKISSVASAIGQVASYAAKIPMLSDFAIPVEWAANGVADVARFFGFSKPHVVEVEKPVVQRPFYHFAHGAGASTATKLSMNPDQGVQTVSLGPEKKDEMALSYLTSRPGLYFNMSWTTSNVRGDCLFQDPMLPSRFYIAQNYTVANVTGSNLVKFNTHLSYLAEMFMYYVGSLLITLNLGATKFHSGRLRFVYVPQMSLPTGQNDSWSAEQLKQVYEQQNKNYHMVMDVRDAMTFTFKTPFEPGQPVIPCEMNMCVTVPALFVFVELPLVATSSVSKTVDGWFSVSGAPGFKFVGPRMLGGTKLLPFAKGVLSKPALEGKPGVNLRAKFQGWDSLTRTETSSLAPGVIDMSGGLNEGTSALQAQTMTVGDVVESLRMLMKRPTECVYFGPSEAYTALWYPWANTTLTGERFESETFFQRVRSLYRFSTGGVVVSGIGGMGTTAHRFKLADMTNLSYFAQRFSITGHGTNGLAISTATTPLADERFSEIPSVCETLHRADLEGMWSYELPYYNQYDKTDNMLVWVAGLTKQLDFVSQFSPPVALAWRTVKDATMSLYIAAAEDFNCGYLNGPPITFVRPLA